MHSTEIRGIECQKGYLTSVETFRISVKLAYSNDHFPSVHPAPRMYIANYFYLSEIIFESKVVQKNKSQALCSMHFFRSCLTVL